LTRVFSSLKRIDAQAGAWLRRNYLPILEIAALGAVAFGLGSSYLNLDVDVVPYGAEFHWVIQTHHFWDWLRECGLCALWYGAERGGSPALVDIQGAILHPIVISTTWLLGVVNGAKITVLLSFWLAGIGQWWLARVLGFGWVTRMWTATLAVVGTHLAGRMELAWLGIILATASASLVFPAALSLARSGSRKDAVILAMTLALAAVAGQAYIQLGLILIVPALLVLVLNGKFRPRPVWKRFLLATGLALLFAAPLLVPFLHFAPNFVKPTDQSFAATQPLEYFVLNFVIRDAPYFLSQALSTPRSAAHAALYIGWVPVLLVFLLPTFAQRKDRRTLLFLALSAAIVIFFASGKPLRALATVIPFLNNFRNPMLIAPLAVTPLLGMAGYSLEKLLGYDWPGEVRLWPRGGLKAIKLNLKWLLLIPLLWALYSAAQFSETYLWTKRIDSETYQIIDALETPSLQWVAMPFNEWKFIEIGIRQGLKLSPGIMPWDWRNRALPAPYLEVQRAGDVPEEAVDITFVASANIYHYGDERQYASVSQFDGQLASCQAYGTGGELRVDCDNPESGILVVYENSWNGWYAWRDGQRVELEDGQWLSVLAPVGEHVYEFRYLPWDVPLGLLLALVGLVWAARQWRKSRNEQAPLNG